MINLEGERVRLRTTERSDRDALIAIRSTPEVLARWRGDDLESEFDADLDDDAEQQLTILDLDGRVIGLIQFGEENEPDYRSASIDIYLAPSVHGRGIGVDAIAMLVRYLMDERGHHRLTIDPAADNEPAIRCYAKVGFQPVGLMRQYERRPDGRWGDALLMDLVASDFDDVVEHGR